MKKLASGLSLLVAALTVSVADAQTNIICRLNPGTSPTTIAARYSLTLLDFTPNAPFAMFGATDGRTISNMEKDSAIVWLEDDCKVGAPEGESKGKPTKGGGLPAVGDRTGLQRINSRLLTQIDWNSKVANSAGRAVRVAILDTGLAPKQKALWSKVDLSMNAIEPNSPAYDIPHNTDSNGNGLTDQAVGHGTMVAGIIDQISPKTRFVIARVADSDGLASGWNVIKGLAFAVTSNAEVANVSLGTLLEVPALGDVVDWCLENNLLIVAPIGNNGTEAACYPSRFDSVVCVGGVDSLNHKTTFSNFNRVCTTSAPAIGFASQFWDGHLAYWSGTSFASPVVAAVVAESLRHTAPTTPEAIKAAILASGPTLDRLNPKYKQKLGVLIDFSKTIKKIGSPSKPGP